jgi:hypothetical protein
MKRFNLFFSIVFIVSVFVNAQTQKIPMGTLSEISTKVIANYPVLKSDLTDTKRLKRESPSGNPFRLMEVANAIDIHKLSLPSLPAWLQIGDTIIVGATPDDTLRITGNWSHKGPILVLGNGVLIFDNATVVDTGDVYVFQNGKLFADSSSLTFPQQFFYERSLIIVQNAFASFNHCSFNYSGMSHSLVMGDSVHVFMNDIHQNDWTTAGLFSKPNFTLSNCNISGEFILMDSCQANFHNADTIILWHHIPFGANINYTFPVGSTVLSHDFNDVTPGVNGIKYNVHADTCQNVMWALMPENGTNVTINNSNVRLIGNWFRYGDTAIVSGLFDSTAYTSFTAPLSDRVLQLNNTYVNTWSLYVFDSSHIDLSNAQVGEVGTQKFSSVTQTNPFLLDGTGGYYWCTDTSSVVSFGATIYTTVRSEKNGLFIMAYDWVPFSAPTAIGNSLMVCVQSQTAADPLPYNAGTVWMTKVDGPDTSFTNTVVPIIGSAWIDWAAAGTGWMDFQSYSVYFTLQSNINWIKIVADSAIEVHHNNVANWNTNGLSNGDYYIRLTSKNIYGDSVDAIYPIHLKTSVIGVDQGNSIHNLIKVYPNPAHSNISIVSNETIVETMINDCLGRLILRKTGSAKYENFDLRNFSPGVYFMKIRSDNNTTEVHKIVID